MTPYPGNPNATEAPSAAPGPGVVPTVNLPVDTDPPNGATFAQAFKVLADFIAWLMSPFAIALAWTQDIVWWRNAKLQKISGIDHFGFWKGRTYGWTENWQDQDYAFGAGPAQRTIGRWRQVITNSGSTIDQPGPGSAGNPFDQSVAIRITTDAAHLGSADMSVLRGGALVSVDGVISCDFDFYADSLTNTRFRFGLCQPPGVPGDIDMTFGTYFEKAFGTAPFTCWANANPNTANVSSGVNAAVTTIYRCRVIVIGANRADDSAAHAMFFINGAKVADLASFIPTGSTLTPFFYAETTTTGGAAVHASWGILDYRQTTAAGGIF